MPLSRPVALQAGVTAAVLAAAAAAPPAEGPMLVLSWKGESAQSIARWAVGDSQRLIAPGPLAPSLIVWGERASLAPRAQAHGAILIGVPAALCGAAA